MTVSAIPNLFSSLTSRLAHASSSNFSEGLRQIGGKAASFFKTVNQEMAGALRSAGRSLSSAYSLVQSARARVVTSPQRFTEAEKTAHLEAAHNSDFYKSFDLPESQNSPIKKEEFDRQAKSLLSTPSAVAAMKQHNVSLSEAVAIRIYTSNDFLAINNALRDGQSNPVITALSAAFTSGLAKLPPYENAGPNAPVVHRGAKLPEEVGNTYQTGAIVQEKGILSTTYDETQKFPNANFSLQVRLKSGSNGKSIVAFSSKPGEGEVAFPPGCKFKVTGRELEGIDSLVQYGVIDPEHMDATNRKHPQGDYGQTQVMNIVMEEV